jgi:hypothetical protein
MPPLDSEEEHASQASWRSTSGTAATARVVLAVPSSLDADATVEVRERPDGWRTVGVVGGATKSIYHAVYKVDSEGRADARVITRNDRTCIRCEGHDHHIPRLRRLWGQAQQALSALKPCFLSGVQRNAALLLKDIYPKYYFRFG